MHTTRRARSTTGLIAAATLATLAALAACGGGGSKHNDGDTGAAAPATVPTPDPARPPDSTAGVSVQTGQRQGVAGDSLGGKGAPVKDSMAKKP